jgi:hypothetical protein
MTTREKKQTEQKVEPRGLGEHARGLAGEYAHEQGWGLNEEQRRKTVPGPQDTDGGTDYDYGAQDFGDEPVNAARVGADGDEEAGKRALGIDEKKQG